MRRALSACLAAAVALAAASGASARPAESGIELLGGSGRVVLNLRGAVLGGLDSGRIAVTVKPGRAPQVLVQGADWQQQLPSGTTVFGGEGIRFRVFRGAWKVVIQGSGINASAVGRGVVRLDGTGRYSLGGGAYQAWPAQPLTVRLGTRTGGRQ